MALKPWLAAALLLLVGTACLWSPWPEPARWALAAFGVALVGWTLTDWDDTVIALAALLLLAASGALPKDAIYAGLGSELVWLLLSGFVMAAVLQRSGLTERWARRMLRGCSTPRALVMRLTLLIGCTAFLVPSTSGRAALLLPIFTGLATQLKDAALQRLLGLLFPSVILLSAGASLLGAGAHLLSVDAMARMGGWQLDFLSWALLATPFAAGSCWMAAEACHRLFLDGPQRAQPLQLSTDPMPPATAEQRRLSLLLGATLLALGTGAWHGQPLALVALAAALIATAPGVSACDWKTAVKGVEWNLLIFLAATLAMGMALLDSGAARLVADALMAHLPPLPGALLLGLAAFIGLISHLLVPSRTARAAVLIPAVALPLAAQGLDVSLLVFTLVLASGFCQTLVVSAKPVLLFAQAGGLAPGDLLRLAACLLLPLWALLGACALWLWPRMAQVLSLG